MWPTSKPSAKLTVHQNTLFFLLCIPCYSNTTAEKVNLRRSSWMNNAWILVQKAGLFRNVKKTCTFWICFHICCNWWIENVKSYTKKSPRTLTIFHLPNTSIKKVQLHHWTQYNWVAGRGSLRKYCKCKNYYECIRS